MRATGNGANQIPSIIKLTQGQTPQFIKLEKALVFYQATRRSFVYHFYCWTGKMRSK